MAPDRGGGTIPIDGDVFVGLGRMGHIGYQHVRTFHSEGVTNVVAVVIKIATNLVVQSVVK